jgi:hypothetical protein
MLYSNSFWTEMVGSGHIGLSGVVLTLSILTWICSFPAFESTTPSTLSRYYHLFLAFSFLSHFLLLAIVYLSRDIKRLECLHWMESFLASNRNTFFVDTFYRYYPSTTDRSWFVDARTLFVHDSGICIVVLSFLLDLGIVVDVGGLVRQSRRRSHGEIAKAGGDIGALAKVEDPEKDEGEKIVADE